MENKFNNLYTLGHKRKSFIWCYKDNRLIISKDIKSYERKNRVIFTRSDIKGFLSYIEDNGWIKLISEGENKYKADLERYIYNNIRKDKSYVKSGPELIAVLHSLGIIKWNGKSKRLAVSIKNHQWKENLDLKLE